MAEKKITWRKYEDVIREQLKSKTTHLIANTYYDRLRGDDQDDDEDEDEFEGFEDFEPLNERIIMRLPEGINNEIGMLTSFDCWMAYTNFDITEPVRDKICEQDGVEILQVRGRYRFFLGVGKMFEFADVRKLIEESVAK